MEERYSSTLSLSLAEDGGGCQRNAPFNDAVMLLKFMTKLLDRWMNEGNWDIMTKTCPGATTNTNPHRLTQELNPDICVERLASNRMGPEMLMFLAAQESENSHSFLTFGDTQREHFTCTLLC
jgi:hypothetical protein